MLTRFRRTTVGKSARLILLAAVSATALFSARRADAKLCGDDVSGYDVPCDCGDIVVSDLTLGDDPVTHTTCPGDGLVVRAVKSPHGILIDLRGKTLQGSGRGAGLWVLNGGPGGARIVSSAGAATITGFRDGLVARGHNSVVLVETLTVRDSARDGLRIEASGTVVRSVETQGARRDGFAIGGRGIQLSGTLALSCGRFGYSVAGSDMTIGVKGAGVIARGSGKAGLSVSGMGHRIVECRASDGKGDGVRLNGMGAELIDCTASRNGGDGIVGTGEHLNLARNHADGNGNNGILIFGQHLDDAGGNAGADNGGGQHARRARQCELGDRPCAP